MSFTPFELSLIAIAAVISALDQGLIDAPILARHLPAVITSPRWRYAPMLLIAIAALAVTWRHVQPPKPIGVVLPQKLPVQTVYVPKNVYVPTPDPAQAAQIADLERQLRVAKASPNKPTAAQPPMSQPATPQPSANVSAPQQPNKAADETAKLNCGEKLDLFKSFVSFASISQMAIRSNDDITDDAIAYGQWVARVEAFLDEAKPADFDKTDFETAHGNDTMKPPSGLNRYQAGIWKEYEGKKNALQKEVVGLANIRCD